MALTYLFCRIFIFLSIDHRGRGEGKKKKKKKKLEFKDSFFPSPFLPFAEAEAKGDSGGLGKRPQKKKNKSKLETCWECKGPFNGFL